jgi:hypothetical protein
MHRGCSEVWRANILEWNVITVQSSSIIYFLLDVTYRSTFLSSWTRRALGSWTSWQTNGASCACWSTFSWWALVQVEKKYFVTTDGKRSTLLLVMRKGVLCYCWWEKKYFLTSDGKRSTSSLKMGKWWWLKSHLFNNVNL